MNRLHNNRLDAFIFLAPTVLMYMVFFYIPIVASFVIAFLDYDIISPGKFVGWDNFRWFFTQTRVPKIAYNTLKFLLILVPLHAVVGLFLALLVKSLNTWTAPMRVLYYFPCILTTASVVIAWRYMFHLEFGVWNYFLSLIGLEPIGWLIDKQWVYVSIAFFSIWRVGPTFIFFYIGLGNIPQELYEAARIDGAGVFRQFRNVTLPLLSPTIFFVVLNLCIGVSQIFDEPYLFTDGGPGDATRTINLFIYEVAFQSFNLGRGSVVSIIMGVILVSFALLQFSLSKKWVYYES